MITQYDDPAQYPRCPRCLQPQYQAGYAAHLAGCTGDGLRHRGRPRKYPQGHKIGMRYRGRYKGRYGHGGARRGEAWEWEKLQEAIKTIGKADAMARQDRKEGEKYPVAYVCLALQISRSTLLRICQRINLPTTVTSGPGQHQAALTTSSLRQLLTYLHQ